MRRPVSSFWGQRNHARHRGIEFLFTFEEWVKWWESRLGPNWFKLRGCRKGQYVMARRGDKGPYASWNVECKTCAENAKDRSYYLGKKKKPLKLTDSQVVEIYLSSQTQKELALLYCVSERLIRLIKSKRARVQVTSVL